MKVSFCIYGPNLNAYEFLVRVEHLPENYALWEDEDIMKEEGPGFTLFFKESNKSSLSYRFIKFIVANRSLFGNLDLIGKHSTKELKFEFDKDEIEEFMTQEIAVYTISPKFLSLMGELEIRLFISRL